MVVVDALATTPTTLDVLVLVSPSPTTRSDEPVPVVAVALCTIALPSAQQPQQPGPLAVDVAMRVVVRDARVHVARLYGEGGGTGVVVACSEHDPDEQEEEKQPASSAFAWHHVPDEDEVVVFTFPNIHSSPHRDCPVQPAHRQPVPSMRWMACTVQEEDGSLVLVMQSGNDCVLLRFCAPLEGKEPTCLLEHFATIPGLGCVQRTKEHRQTTVASVSSRVCMSIAETNGHVYLFERPQDNARTARTALLRLAGSVLGVALLPDHAVVLSETALLFLRLAPPQDNGHPSERGPNDDFFDKFPHLVGGDW